MQFSGLKLRLCYFEEWRDSFACCMKWIHHFSAAEMSRVTIIINLVAPFYNPNTVVSSENPAGGNMESSGSQPFMWLYLNRNLDISKCWLLFLFILDSQMRTFSSLSQLIPSLRRCTHLLSFLSFLPTLLLVSLSSSWDGIGVRATPTTRPTPESVWVFAAFAGSAGDICCGVALALSLAPECRCFWRRQSWQREGSKMLGWNLGHVGSSPVGSMLGSSLPSYPVSVHSASLFHQVTMTQFNPNWCIIFLLCC